MRVNRRRSDIEIIAEMLKVGEMALARPRSCTAQHEL
jgi:hypothetical protein